MEPTTTTTDPAPRQATPDAAGPQFAIERELPDAVHLPGAFYTSPAVYAAEKEAIFTKDWLCVARVEQLAEVGDYMTRRIAGEPVLLVRESADRISAFANVCLHRGVEVAFGSGRRKAFSCPYHAWSYSLAGELLSAPIMDDSHRDLKGETLPRLHCEVWRGWVFINFDAAAAPLAQYVAPVEEAFGFMKPEDLKLGFINEVVVDSNWKFCIENVLDIYHVSAVHNKSFGQYVKGDRRNFRFTLLDNGCSSLFFDAAPSAPGGKGLFRKLRAFDDKPDSIAIMGVLPPNVRIAGRRDMVRYYIMWPEAVDKTRFMIYSLVEPEEIAKPEFEQNAGEYRKMVDQIVDEDRQLLESLQRGATSRNYVPGPLSHLEAGIHHLLQRYLQRLPESLKKSIHRGEIR